jgi:hypothetical protein
VVIGYTNSILNLVGLITSNGVDCTVIDGGGRGSAGHGQDDGGMIGISAWSATAAIDPTCAAVHSHGEP